MSFAVSLRLALVLFCSVSGSTCYFSSFFLNLVLHDTNLQPWQEKTPYIRCQHFWKMKTPSGSVPPFYDMLHFLQIDSICIDQAELAVVCSNWKDWLSLSGEQHTINDDRIVISSFRSNASFRFQASLSGFNVCRDLKWVLLKHPCHVPQKPRVSVSSFNSHANHSYGNHVSIIYLSFAGFWRLFA